MIYKLRLSIAVCNVNIYQFTPQHSLPVFVSLNYYVLEGLHKMGRTIKMPIPSLKNAKYCLSVYIDKYSYAQFNFNILHFNCIMSSWKEPSIYLYFPQFFCWILRLFWVKSDTWIIIIVTNYILWDWPFLGIFPPQNCTNFLRNNKCTHT